MALKCSPAMRAVLGCFRRLGWSRFVQWIILEPPEGQRWVGGWNNIAAEGTSSFAFSRRPALPGRFCRSLLLEGTGLCEAKGHGQTSWKIVWL